MTKSVPRLLLMAQEDLKCELFELKKRSHEIASENYLLKVKVRKLQNEVDKKNKQIECLLDPKKSTNVRKIISERGATMIINLKQRNNDLEQALMAKDLHIKKLQATIDTSKVYSTRETLHSFVRNMDHKNIPQKSYENTYQTGNLRSRCLSGTPTPKYSYFKANSDVQLEYVRLAQNLQKIKLANKRPLSQTSLKNDTKTDVVSNKSADSEDSESVENEHMDLDEYLVNMIAEMDKMKQTISELSAEQENMKKILKEKNSNIEILAKRVRHLQRRKYKKHSRSPPKSLQKTEQEVDKNLQNVEIGSLEQSNHENQPDQSELLEKDKSQCVEQNSVNTDAQKTQEMLKNSLSIQTYTEDSFEDDFSAHKATLSSNESSTVSIIQSSTSNGSKIDENDTNVDDDDDDVQTGESIND